MAPEKLSTSESSSGKLVEVTGWDHHKTIFVTCLFVISAIVLKILYHRCRYIAKFIPESCVFILFGSAIDFLLSGTSAAVARLKPTFTIDIFFAVLLPPIMLESAYSLNQKHFYLNIIPVLLYAVIGTVLNIATIGPSLYVVELLGAKKWLHIPHISLLELTIFGATLSAIDPVSVLAIFKDLRVKRSLYYLVFGESLLNDAVVLVIHRILLDMLDAEKQSFSARVLLLGIAKFCIVSGGSLLIGLLFGVLSSLLTLATRHVEDSEPILLLVLAYSAYVSAEIFEWSGVVSIICCGLVQAEFALRNVSLRSRITVHHYVTTLSSTSDGIIFIFIGMVVVQTKHYWNVAFILLTLAFCVLYRLLSVLSLACIANHTGATFEWVSLREQLLMVHGGLRGAIAYILIFMLVQKEQSQQQKGAKNVTATGRVAGAGTAKAAAGAGGPWYGHSFSVDAVHYNHYNRTAENWTPRPAIQLLQTTTLCVILVTVFIMGSTTKPLLKYLQIKRELGNHHTSIFSQLNDQMFDDTSEFIRRIVSDKPSQSCFYRTACWLNQRFFRRIFLRKSKCINEGCDDDEESDEESTESDDEEPLITPKTTSSSTGKDLTTRKGPLTVPSLVAVAVATPYERILRHYLAKQLRHKAKSMALRTSALSPPMSGDGRRSRTENGGPDHRSVSICPSMVESNGKEMVVHGEHQKATTPKLWQAYEFDGRRRSISTANQHDQPNRINVSLHTPERVGEATADLTLPYSSSSAMTQRRLNSSSSQQWRWARPTAATAAVGPLSLLTSDLRPRQRALTSAQTYFPNSRASLWSGPPPSEQSTVSLRGSNRKQSLSELKSTRLPTTNGLPLSNGGPSKLQFDPPPAQQRTTIADWSRNRNRETTVVPFNLSSARSDT